MEQYSVSAEPLAWALERLGIRAGAAARDNESSRVAVSFLQLASEVRRAGSLQEAITITIAGLPPGSQDASGVDALISGLVQQEVADQRGAHSCIWEDCDQLAKYCQGHATELVDPLGQLEELRACVDVVRELWEELDAEMHTVLRGAPSLDRWSVLSDVEKIWRGRGRELGRKLGAVIGACHGNVHSFAAGANACDCGAQRRNDEGGRSS